MHAHPAHAPIGAQDPKLALAGKAGAYPLPGLLKQPLPIFRVNCLMPAIAEAFLRRSPGDRLPARVYVLAPTFGVQLKDPDGGGGTQDAEAGLAGADRIFHVLALGDHLGEHRDPAHFPADRVPGPDLPAHPVYGAIGAFKAILIAAHHLARQRPPVKLLPTFGNLWKDLVVCAPDDLLIAEAVILHPPLADEDVAHLPVKHRHRSGHVLDELTKQRRIRQRHAAWVHPPSHPAALPRWRTPPSPWRSPQTTHRSPSRPWPASCSHQMAGKPERGTPGIPYPRFPFWHGILHEAIPIWKNASGRHPARFAGRPESDRGSSSALTARSFSTRCRGPCKMSRKENPCSTERAFQ